MKKIAYDWAKSVLWIALMAVAARARAADTIAPFACAVYFTARGMGVPTPVLLLGCAAGCAFGAAGAAGWMPTVGCAVVELLCMLPGEKRLGTAAWSSVCAFAGTLLPGILFSCGIVYNLIAAALCAVVSMAAAPILLPAGGDWFRRGFCTREEQIALVALMVVVTMGLGERARGIFAAIMVLAASSGGAGAGALVGVVLGAAMVLGGAQNVAAAVLGMAGALCGMLAGVGAWLRALVFVAVCQFTYLGPFGYSLPAVPMAEAVIGAICALMLPEGRIRGFFLPSFAESGALQEKFAAEQNRARAEGKLKLAAEALGEAALCTQDAEAGGLFSALCRSLFSAETRRENRAPRLRVVAGAAAKACGEINGDSYAVQLLPDGRIFAMICDGMGSGEAARRQSEKTVRLIRALLRAGVAEDAAVRAANWLLLGGEETFSTLDLAVIDPRRSTMRIYKMAAPPTVYMRGARAVGIEGNRLPIGVVRENAPSFARLALKKGDMIFMGSDGVTDACAPGGIARHMQKCREMHPRKICTSLLAAQKDPQDDMTVIVVKLM